MVAWRIQGHGSSSATAAAGNASNCLIMFIRTCTCGIDVGTGGAWPESVNNGFEEQ
jgi:hypothetical protein